jgi:hypothetical protein
LIALAQADYQIVGVELSASMLEVAVQQRFALALIPARAFQFLLTPLDQRGGWPNGAMA